MVTEVIVPIASRTRTAGVTELECRGYASVIESIVATVQKTFIKDRHERHHRHGSEEVAYLRGFLDDNEHDARRYTYMGTVIQKPHRYRGKCRV
jgi:hypothetical protein